MNGLKARLPLGIVVLCTCIALAILCVRISLQLQYQRNISAALAAGLTSQSYGVLETNLMGLGSKVSDEIARSLRFDKQFPDSETATFLLDGHIALQVHHVSNAIVDIEAHKLEFR
jgi:hypothetical protein